MLIFVLKDWYLRTILGIRYLLSNLYLKLNEGHLLDFKVHYLIFVTKITCLNYIFFKPTKQEENKRVNLLNSFSLL